MIRVGVFIAGLMIVFGALGNLDIDPNASVVEQGAFAFLGLLLMSLSFPIFRDQE